MPQTRHHYVLSMFYYVTLLCNTAAGRELHYAKMNYVANLYQMYGIRYAKFRELEGCGKPHLKISVQTIPPPEGSEGVIY